MTTSCRWTAAVALTAALVTTPAVAQIRPGAVTLSPMVGGYSFDGDQDLQDRAVYGLGVGYDLSSRWGLELVGNYIDSRSDAGLGDAQVSSLRADALYYFRPGKRLVPYLSAGVGGIHFDPDYHSDTTDPLVDVGAGIKYFLSPRVALRGDLRNLDSFDDTEVNWAAAGGLTLLFGGEHQAMPTLDSDGDGVNDDRDQCPETPPGTTVGADGCPPPTPAPARASAPALAPVDTDGDGVTDAADRCPHTPAGAPVDAVGCPKDTDGDGVADYLDQCPNTPRAAKVDPRGCWVLQGVHFATSKANLTGDSTPILDAVVPVLQANPALRLEVQGHTDSTGSARLNQHLSEQRAQTVAAYLTAHGIDASRLTTKGYGPTQPAATNATSDGRAQNRRVELKPLP